ncbi:hypothetical protein B9Z55_021581 [Caenorhabditis nigoni]|nr:hypothetical protein B9Z55_021581 [Caenorhabditis nigoni]
MEIDELIALSLCSKRTKNLVKSSNRKIYQSFVNIDEECIGFDIMTGPFQKIVSLDIFDSYIELGGTDMKTFWIKEVFTQSDWIAHIMSIFNESIINFLTVEDVSMNYLDTVKQFIPKCQKLSIREECSRKFTKIAFLKLCYIAEEVKIDRNIFDDDDNDISKYLTLNLKSVSFVDWENPFKLELADLLALNITDLTIGPTNITEKDLNRFLKLWMKGICRFYRPERIYLSFRNDIIREEVIRRIKFEIVDDECLLTRADGKKLLIDIGLTHVALLPAQIMPIRLLSLPSDDLQYVIDSMDVSDLIALSLCSKRTKDLVENASIAINEIGAEVDENRINLNILTYKFHGHRSTKKTIKFVLREDCSIDYERDDGFQKWENTEFTLSHLIYHFLSLSNLPVIGISELPKLKIKSVNPITYLDTVKQEIPKCQILKISENCSDDVAKMAFFKLAPMAVEVVKVKRNIFDKENDISKLLSLNLRSVIFNDFENPIKVTLDDHLVVNIHDLAIQTADITERDLNRFLKLWVKGNHRFYRPKFIRLTLDEEFIIRREKVFKGIKYEEVNEDYDDGYQFRVDRGDGKELMIYIDDNHIVFKFKFGMP